MSPLLNNVLVTLILLIFTALGFVLGVLHTRRQIFREYMADWDRERAERRAERGA